MSLGTFIPTLRPFFGLWVTSTRWPTRDNAQPDQVVFGPANVTQESLEQLGPIRFSRVIVDDYSPARNRVHIGVESAVTGVGLPAISFQRLDQVVGRLGGLPGPDILQILANPGVGSNEAPELKRFERRDSGFPFLSANSLHHSSTQMSMKFPFATRKKLALALAKHGDLSWTVEPCYPSPMTTIHPEQDSGEVIYKSRPFIAGGG